MTKTIKKVSSKVFLDNTSESERTELRKNLVSAIEHFISTDRAVWLERLGFCIPKIVDLTATHSHQNKNYLRKETHCQIIFEKYEALDLLGSPVSTRPAEVKDLAAFLHPKLPLNLSLKWTLDDVKFHLLGLIAHIRDELILTGYSDQLLPLGKLYALRNRQGESFEDWFASANIFFSSTHSFVTRVEPAHEIPPLVLNTAWELFEAAYGPPVKKLVVNIEQELKNLGYGSGSLAKTELPVAVFKRPGGRKSEDIYLYCTDTLRNEGLSRGSEFGVELLFQLLVKGSDTEFPMWPVRAITLGWILVQSAKNGSVQPGAGLLSEDPVCDTLHNNNAARGVFITSCKIAPKRYFTESGSFEYRSLISIQEDEAEIASKHSPDFLIDLLALKGLDQVTRSPRQSIGHRTTFVKADAGSHPMKESKSSLNGKSSVPSSTERAPNAKFEGESRNDDAPAPVTQESFAGV